MSCLLYLQVKANRMRHHLITDPQLQNGYSNKTLPTQVTDCNPALWTRQNVTLDIEPFPPEIPGKINVGEVYQAREKDGEPVVPRTGLYWYVWDGASIYLEEKSEAWVGVEFGTTAWLACKPLGTYSTSMGGSLLQDLQCQGEINSTVEAVNEVTGNREVENYWSSLVTAGDNHITTLTAAYCMLFDRLWSCCPPCRTQLTSVAFSKERHTGCLQFPPNTGVSPRTLSGRFCGKNSTGQSSRLVTNAQHVNFWKAVCGEGKNFSSLFWVGDKSFVSPWATQWVGTCHNFE